MNRRSFIKAIAAVIPAVAFAPLSLATHKPQFVTADVARTIYFPHEPLLDHQVIETRKLSVEEIAAVFRVPPEFIGPRYAKM